MSQYLTVNRIEFIVTYRCNSHCKHCQVGQSLRTSHPAAIDQDLAVEITREVAQAYSPRSIMTFGGEPLLFPDTVCAIHRTARANGIGSRTVITNAGWPRSETEFRKVAHKLAENGVNDVMISVDSFHQEHVRLAVVERNAQSLVDAGIPLQWNPCWLVSREHDNPWNRRTRAVLQALAHLPVAEDSGNIVQPEGNALRWLHDYMPSRTPCPAGTCGDMPYTGRLDQVNCIAVEPDASIAVCEEFAIGNARQEGIVEMLRSYDPYCAPQMRLILDDGVAGLAELARSRGVRLDTDGYYSICGMCTSIRRELAELDASIT